MSKEERKILREKRKKFIEQAKDLGLSVNQVWCFGCNTYTNAYAAIGSKTWAFSLENSVTPKVKYGDRFIIITTKNEKYFVVTGLICSEVKCGIEINDIWPETWKDPIEILPLKNGFITADDLREIFGKDWSSKLTLHWSHAPSKISQEEIKDIEDLLQ